MENVIKTIKDDNGNIIYEEDISGYKRKYDSKGNEIYFENEFGYWYKREYDSNGNYTWENSDGVKFNSKGERILI